MKEYLFNKRPKDARFLAVFRKSFNKERIVNGFTMEEASNELGMSQGTLEQKLKVGADFARLTYDEINHHMHNSLDLSVLEFIAREHNCKLVPLYLDRSQKSEEQVNTQADKAMLEFNEAWAKVKNSLIDDKFDRKEKNETLRGISEAIKELQQLQHDVEYVKVQE
jgi:hypothetical protein